MSWLNRLTAGRAKRSVPVAEVMEPRILYSADLAAGLGLDGGFTGVAQTRTLTAAGEYDASLQQAPAISVAATYAGSALAFESNQGQDAAGVEYFARGQRLRHRAGRRQCGADPGHAARPADGAAHPGGRAGRRG